MGHPMSRVAHISNFRGAAAMSCRKGPDSPSTLDDGPVIVTAIMERISSRATGPSLQEKCGMAELRIRTDAGRRPWSVGCPADASAAIVKKSPLREEQRVSSAAREGGAAFGLSASHLGGEMPTTARQLAAGPMLQCTKMDGCDAQKWVVPPGERHSVLNSGGDSRTRILTMTRQVIHIAHRPLFFCGTPSSRHERCRRKSSPDGIAATGSSSCAGTRSVPAQRASRARLHKSDGPSGGQFTPQRRRSEKEWIDDFCQSRKNCKEQDRKAAAICSTGRGDK